MTQTPEISVVIPAHNAAATIGVQLAALAEQQTNHPFEVIVVDNRSSDDTARWGYPQIVDTSRLRGFVLG